MYKYSNILTVWYPSHIDQLLVLSCAIDPWIELNPPIRVAVGAGFPCHGESKGPGPPPMPSTPGNKALIRPYKGTMVLHNPLDFL